MKTNKEKKEILRIENLIVKIGEKIVINDISLSIKEGETHILFGPNGSGKSSLIKTIMGFEDYKVVQGKIYFKGEDITEIPIYERAKRGIAIAFQHPVPIKGIKLSQMIDIIKKNGFNKEYWAEKLKLKEHLSRDINVGFSGGEMKRSEIYQILAQNPSFVMLDEPESGVDIENIKLLGEVIGLLLEKNKHIVDRKKSGLIITHTGYILDYIAADKGYVMVDGKITCSSNPFEILRNIASNGFKECIKCLK